MKNTDVFKGIDITIALLLDKGDRVKLKTDTGEEGLVMVTDKDTR